MLEAVAGSRDQDVDRMSRRRLDRLSSLGMVKESRKILIVVPLSGICNDD